ncbi:hypothetical protein D9V41_13175 [Aeromicrobium phragmitis]|uniref:DUF559 domain-containing protein n=1 Tax=Aeromicrobium phragmitis TaxID=2478914 RepID=A0A3L8PM02_9ACTN|nr:hypothetical protein [Aeromicrobium phragmitis]RLV55042.1 hypothetical protein D9V41_13175 [Aeromicrobium phragmitis]
MSSRALVHLSPAIAREVEQLFASQHGVAGRGQLLRAGVSRWVLQANVRGERWRAHGRQTIAEHTGELTPPARRWHAVLEAGPRAALDGVSALAAAGLTGWEVDHERVSVPRGARVRRPRGVVIRQTRRWRAEDIVRAGVPRVRVPVAAVHAALWVRTPRQAATILSMVVQQRLCPAEDIGRALLAVRRDRRRRLLEDIVVDLLGGAQAMGEIDLARMCRRAGLPAPSRQRVRRTSRGTTYLDAEWPEFHVALEVDGVHHLGAEAIIGDALRHNDIALDHSTVLRVPVLGLRVAPGDFLDQLASALEAGGWRRAA